MFTILRSDSLRASRLGLIVLFGFQASALFGSMISSHVGLTDPLSENFLGFHESGSALASDLSYSAWHMTPSAESAEYYDPLTDAERSAAFLSGWTLEGRLRLPSATESYPTGAFLNIDFGTRRFDINLFIQDSKLYVRSNTSIVTDTSGTTVGGLVQQIEGSASAYHLYTMVYNPVLAAASLSIDGNLVFSGYSGHTDYLTANGVWFGAYGQPVNVNLAQFSIQDSADLGQYAPEPATAALLFAGIAAIALRARRR